MHGVCGFAPKCVFRFGPYAPPGFALGGILIVVGSARGGNRVLPHGPRAGRCNAPRCRPDPPLPLQGGRAMRAKELARCAQAPASGRMLRALDARLAAYERRFGLRTTAMRAQLAAGAMAETWDVCEWLHLADLRRRIRG